jgi:hypothetical protein
MNDDKKGSGSDGIKMNAPKEGESSPSIMPNEDIRIHKLTELTEQLKEKNARITELTAFLYNLLEQYQDDFMADSNAFMNRSMIAKQIRTKLKMTPEMYEIIHRSKEQAEQNGQ